MRADIIEVNGAIVFWKIAQRSDRQKIADGLTAIGLADYVPKERTPYAVLTDAARECVGKGYLIRPLEKNRGIAIVREDRGGVSSGNDYRNRAQVLCPTNGHIDVQYGLDHEQESRLNTYYAALKHALPPSAVGLSLSKIAVECMGGTRSLRDSGGIYWMPQRTLPDWGAVVRVFEEAAIDGTSEIYTVATMNTPETIRAIRDSIVEEVREAAAAVRTEIEQGIGHKAIATRRDVLVAYSKKLGQYELVIGDVLSDVRKELEETEFLAAKAELALLAAIGNA